jgi:hypothetical protein
MHGSMKIQKPQKPDARPIQQLRLCPAQAHPAVGRKRKEEAAERPTLARATLLNSPFFHFFERCLPTLSHSGASFCAQPPQPHSVTLLVTPLIVLVRGLSEGAARGSVGVHLAVAAPRRIELHEHVLVRLKRLVKILPV